MRRQDLATLFVCFLSVGMLATAPVAAAEKLGDMLRESKWDRILGSWVDAETNGTRFATRYTWRIKDRVLEVSSKMGERETVALIAVNGKTGDVIYTSADSEGSTAAGKWQLEGDEAVLNLEYITADGQEGEFGFRQRLVNDDTLAVTLEFGQPFEFQLVRAKQERKSTAQDEAADSSRDQ